MRTIEYDLYSEYVNYVNRSSYISITDVKDLVKDIPSKLKDVFNMISELSKSFKGKVSELIELFKNKPLFEFMKEFGFSLKKLFDYISSIPSKLVNPLVEKITEYADKTGVVTWTTNELKKLDNWLDKHPFVKNVSGIALAALVIYINMNVTYYGDINSDFDMTDFANALLGDFSLASIFGGVAGVKLFTLFLTNASGLSVPWSGYKQFLLIFINCLTSLIKKLRKSYNDMIDKLNKIKSFCKTKGQRVAFNELVKSFSTTGEISINDLKKWADSKFNKSPQAGEYNCIKLIEFIINNSNPQPKSNLGGVLHLIKIDEHDDRVLLSYSYERNIKEIRYGEDSLLGQLIDGKWTWYVKFLGKVTKKVTSGMDVIEFVNKIVNEMLQK